MSDLVERLRDVAGFIEKEHGRVAAAACLATEAAARIQQLEAALRKYACGCSGRKCDPDRYPCGEDARAALEGGT